jgi:hypothetical protein
MAWWDRKPGRINNQEPDADAETIVYDAVTLPPGTESMEQNTTNMNNVTTNATTTNAAAPSTTAPAATPPAVVQQEQHPVLTAALAAGINTADAFTSLHADAGSFRASIEEKRQEARDRVTALYANDPAELSYQNAILDTLPVGEALNTHLARLNTSYDKKFGTSENSGASRTSAPNQLNTQTPRVAVDAVGTVEAKHLSTEQKEQATQQTLASY